MNFEEAMQSLKEPPPSKGPSLWDPENLDRLKKEHATKQGIRTRKIQQGNGTRDNPVPLPAGSVAFDIETDSVEFLWSQGREFIRLNGWWEPGNGADVQIATNPFALRQAIECTTEDCGFVVGHNILSFDLLALERLYGVDILDLARRERILDTKLVAFLADPPASRMKSGEIEKYYSLEEVGKRLLGMGKITGENGLKALAKRFGGFGKIPQDNEDYRRYLTQDVLLTRDLAEILEFDEYAKREHKIAAIAAAMSLAGFRVDVALLGTRIDEGDAKRARIVEELGLDELPGKSPHRSLVGIAAIDDAFRKLGVELPLTASGRPALGKPILDEVAEQTDNPMVVELVDAVQGLNGIRTVYGNVQDNLVGDRCHPAVNMRQSSGRWSITNPGLTVMGKRGGKYREREVFLADEGDVLIALDLAGIDQRAVAALSQDHNYLDLFEPGRDLHAEMAERLLGDKSLRERAKAMSHGLPYGLGAEKLAKSAGISLEEAQSFKHQREVSFPVLADWERLIRQEAELNGYLRNGYGRLMKVDKDRSFTVSVALMGQSTARDLLMQGLLNLWERGGDEIIRRLRAVIHDEVVFSVPPQDAQEIGRLISDCLTFEWAPPESGGRPVLVLAEFDGKACDSWGALYAK